MGSDATVPGLNMFDRQRLLSEKIRKSSESSNSELVGIRNGILVALTQKDNKAQQKTIQRPDPRFYLIAQYLLGIDISYVAIVGGLYPQAANLQKQQIETLARIEEIRDGKQKEGKVPNVSQKN